MEKNIILILTASILVLTVLTPDCNCAVDAHGVSKKSRVGSINLLGQCWGDYQGLGCIK
jgi:hypothetical protein